MPRSDDTFYTQTSHTTNASSVDVENAANMSESIFASSQADLVRSLSTPKERVKVIWGTDIAVDDTLSKLSDFFNGFSLAQYKESVGAIVFDYDTQPYFRSIAEEVYIAEIDFVELDARFLRCVQPELYTQLLTFPREMIPIIEVAFSDYVTQLYPDFKRTIRVRLHSIHRKVNLRSLDPSDIDQLVCVHGIAIRASNVVPELRVAFYRCRSCRQETTIELSRGLIEEPQRCPKCTAVHSLELQHNLCSYNDKQILKLQETPEEIEDGQTPHNVTVCLYDDLFDVCRPGDRVTITGIYSAAPVRLNRRVRSVKNVFRCFVDAVHVAVEQRKEKEYSTESIRKLASRSDVYEYLANAIAPAIHGHADVKKALLLQLVGGCSKKLGDVTYRGSINVLLAGDPGVSKSQLLKFINKLSPRGLYTSGKGSSAVGLTAYVTRDAETKQFVLESGALVLCDNGICCIDEFDKMSETTRSVLHEVMEQQTISVAKAGIVTTLNARTSILAAANPVDSRYNVKKSIVQNLNLPPPLLSRFDLVFILLDKVEEEYDRCLASHLLGFYGGEKEEVPIDPLLLRAYIVYVRELQPHLTREACEVAAQGYVDMRQTNSGKTVSATTRQLESIIRLAEAHAKVRMSDTVDPQDVIEAMRLIRESLCMYAIDPVTGRIDMDLVTTGRSKFAREQHEQLKSAISETLGRYRDVDSLQEYFKESMKTYVDRAMIFGALHDLEKEGVLSLTEKGEIVVENSE